LNPIRLTGLVLGVLLAATEAAAPSPGLMGQVVRVVDGNTIEVRIGDRTETVRYIGMNAPLYAIAPISSQTQCRGFNSGPAYPT
jgi:endonuclease YncB( thermonuclease family)